VGPLFISDPGVPIWTPLPKSSGEPEARVIVIVVAIVVRTARGYQRKKAKKKHYTFHGFS